MAGNLISGKRALEHDFYELFMIFPKLYRKQKHHKREMRMSYVKQTCLVFAVYSSILAISSSASSGDEDEFRPSLASIFQQNLDSDFTAVPPNPSWSSAEPMLYHQLQHSDMKPLRFEQLAYPEGHTQTNPSKRARRGSARDDSTVCRAVCTPCRKLLSLSVAALCWQHCENGGPFFDACVTSISVYKAVQASS
ncbi:hypothetical protein CAPTEDRAFT_218214 [Capitella teleta]|uniref:Uncharacterized protein n=1 Tax=Capitella teleta TaxID=283909 RepID=R7VJU4_CAPTE|nr:hypothetical protein CAPTEDRAFT_218214 [Capitella teleta]|eukprot:ELU16195.1 hypothetical protein CAPTEDRAFT_218214 [Capitella teleta]